jgi:hypothetical protein
MMLMIDRIIKWHRIMGAETNEYGFIPADADRQQVEIQTHFLLQGRLRLLNKAAKWRKVRLTWRNQVSRKDR